MWFENNFRRHLCDMHMDDWNEAFLAQFSPEEYFENLKTAKVTNAMLYFQSHVGLCYYPTRSGKMHNAFRGREDMMRKLVRMCRSNGIAVTGYYSLIYNNWAYHEHPEWRMIEKGQPDFGESSCPAEEETFAANHLNRYGVCCPNNPGYRGFVSEQIKEICEYFEFDGMFFDMLFWKNLCQCKYCRSRFKRETGYELPQKEDWTDPVWLLHIRKRREWMGKFAQSVTEELKSYVPHASVEHNVVFAALPGARKCLGEEVLNACDYVGGDLYGDMYQQSFTCKFYRNIGKNHAFEYMPSRCEPNLSKHTITKSEEELLSTVLLTSAHHGATLVIDAINPNGTLDKRFYQRLGRVYEKSSAYERYFTGDMIEDAGIYYTLRSKFNPCGESYTNHEGCVNLTRQMIKNHICCGITGGYYDLKRYPVVIAPCLTEEDAYDYERIADYVKEGGLLYISGGACTGLIKEFFKAEVAGRTQECITYISPKQSVSDAFGWFNEEYPLQFDGSAPIVKGIEKEKVLANITLPYTPQNTVRFVSIHSNPPGLCTDIPAMAVTEYGKGRVLWSALPIENIKEPYHYGEVFLALLQQIFGLRQTITSNAPADVEITAFQDENSITVSAVQYCETAHARRIGAFDIHIKTDKIPKKLLQLPEEAECGFEYQNGVVSYKVEDLKIFDMKRLVF